ncbi:MAG: UPF0182 family protein [Bacteroidetes bacterium]|nr:UPF0182 family protein [Bacteroidota bacterium]
MKENDQSSAILNKFIKIIIIIVTILIGSIFSSKWHIILKYFNPTTFNIKEEVFTKDISFYVFKLPFLLLIKNFIFSTILITSIIIILAYLFYTRIRKKQVVLDEERMFTDFRLSNLKEKSIKHISILWSLLLFSLAFWFLLARYGILFSTRGVVFGAAYTDIKIFLPFYLILTIISLAGALYFLFYKRKNLKVIYLSITAIFIILLLGTGISFVVQSLIVEPNELNLEREYISRNIKHTIEAYGLSNIDEKEFSVEYDLTLNDIKNNKK